MKSLIPNFIFCYSATIARPQNNFGSFSSNSFSNFDTNSQTFTAGTNTQLNQQTFQNSQDAFFQSVDSNFDNGFPSSGLGPNGFEDFLDPLDKSFDVFSSANGKG